MTDVPRHDLMGWIRIWDTTMSLVSDWVWLAELWEEAVSEDVTRALWSMSEVEWRNAFPARVIASILGDDTLELR